MLDALVAEGAPAAIWHGRFAISEPPDRESRTAVSVVIPVHNEAALLCGLIGSLIAQFRQRGLAAEFLVCENGSTDGTVTIANELASAFGNVRLLSLCGRSYGMALRMGILHARYDQVVIFNADLWSMDFCVRATERLSSGADIVIGSKCLVRQNDKRALIRRLITWSFNSFLRVAFGFSGTDTHGMKALRRSRLLPILQSCTTNGEVFDTELVLRAQYGGLEILEIPVCVQDLRPARLSLLRRVPSTARDLMAIARSLRERDRVSRRRVEVAL